MQRPIPDPKQPHVDSLGMLRSETPRCGENVIGDGPASAVHVNGDVLSIVVGLDLGPDVSLVDRFPKAGRLLPGTSDRRRHLLSPTSEGTLLHMIFYDNRQIQDNSEGPAHRASNRRHIERARTGASRWRVGWTGTRPAFLRPYASHHRNRESFMRRQATEPHLKDGGIYRTRWWASGDSNHVMVPRCHRLLLSPICRPRLP